MIYLVEGALSRKGCKHMADVKELLSNYIGSTNDGMIKAFV